MTLHPLAAALILIACSGSSSGTSDRITITKEAVVFELAVPDGRAVLHLDDVRVGAGHSGVLEVRANGEPVTELYLVPARSDAQTAGQNLVVPLPETVKEKVTITLTPKQATRITLLRPSISAGR